MVGLFETCCSAMRAGQSTINRRQPNSEADIGEKRNEGPQSAQTYIASSFGWCGEYSFAAIVRRAASRYLSRHSCTWVNPSFGAAQQSRDGAQFDECCTSRECRLTEKLTDKLAMLLKHRDIPPESDAGTIAQLSKLRPGANSGEASSMKRQAGTRRQWAARFRFGL